MQFLHIHTYICVSLCCSRSRFIAQTNHWHCLDVWFLYMLSGTIVASTLLVYHFHCCAPCQCIANVPKHKFAQGLFYDLAFIPTFNIYTSTLYANTQKPTVKVLSYLGFVNFALVGILRCGLTSAKYTKHNGWTTKFHVSPKIVSLVAPFRYQIASRV